MKSMKMLVAVVALFAINGCAANRIYTPLDVNYVFRPEDRWTDQIPPVTKVSVTFEESVPMTDPFLEVDAPAK